MAQSPKARHGDAVLYGFTDFQKNEARNLRLHQLATDPAEPVDGLILYRTDTNKARVRINGVWQDLATMADVTAGGISSGLIDAKGDLLVGDAPDSVVRLPVSGVNGRVLSENSATATGLQWIDAPAGYSDEEAQDAVGLILVDSATLDLTYNDATPSITGAVLDSPTVGGNTPTFLLARGNHTGEQAIGTVTGLQGALDAKVDDSQVGAANGVASLDGGGLVPSAQLPALALTDVHVVADITARDALTVQEGDVAIVLDAGGGEGNTFIYDGAAWQEMATPTDGVTAVTATGYLASSGGATPEITWAGTDLAVGDGGTGASDAAGARANLGALGKAAGALTGGTNSEILTHNLNTRDISKVTLINGTTPFDAIDDFYWEATTVNTVTIYAGAGFNLPAGYRWVVTG